MEIDKRIYTTESLNLGGLTVEIDVSLLLYSEDIDIPAITDLLGCEPTHAHRRADRVKPNSPPSSVGLWRLEAPDDLSFTDKLTYLLNATTSEQNIWNDLAASHQIRLSCAAFLHTWTDGFVIPSETIAEIGRRHWQFGLSMYSAEGDEIVDAFLSREDGTSKE